MGTAKQVFQCLNLVKAGSEIMRDFTQTRHSVIHFQCAKNAPKVHTTPHTTKLDNSVIGQIQYNPANPAIVRVNFCVY